MAGRVQHRSARRPRHRTAVAPAGCRARSRDPAPRRRPSALRRPAPDIRAAPRRRGPNPRTGAPVRAGEARGKRRMVEVRMGDDDRRHAFRRAPGRPGSRTRCAAWPGRGRSPRRRRARRSRRCWCRLAGHRRGLGASTRRTEQPPSSLPSRPVRTAGCRHGVPVRSIRPAGLYGRAALILIVPVVTIQLVVSVAFIQRHFDGVTRQMTQAGAAGALAAAAAAGRRGRRGRHSRGGAGRRPWPDRGRVPAGRHRRRTCGSGRSDGPAACSRRCATQSPAVVGPRNCARPDRRCGADGGARGGRAGSLSLRCRGGGCGVEPAPVAGLDGLHLGPDDAASPLYFLRNAVAADHAAGRRRPRPSARARTCRYSRAGRRRCARRGGPSSRCGRGSNGRSRAARGCSGVSHDLRTPLTRMRLGLSMLPEDDETRALQDDVAQMQRHGGRVPGLRARRRDGGGGADRPAWRWRGRWSTGGRRSRAAGAARQRRAGAAPRRSRLRPQAVARALENLVGNAGAVGSRAVSR